MKNELEKYINKVLEIKRQKHIKLAKQRRRAQEEEIAFRKMDFGAGPTDWIGCNDYFANCCNCCGGPTPQDCPTDCGATGNNCNGSYSAAVSGLTGLCACGNQTVTCNRVGGATSCTWSGTIFGFQVGGASCCFDGFNLTVDLTCPSAQQWKCRAYGSSYDLNTSNDCATQLDYSGLRDNLNGCPDGSYTLDRDMGACSPATGISCSVT